MILCIFFTNENWKGKGVQDPKDYATDCHKGT